MGVLENFLTTNRSIFIIRKKLRSTKEHLLRTSPIDQHACGKSSWQQDFPRRARRYSLYCICSEHSTNIDRTTFIGAEHLFWYSHFSGFYGETLRTHMSSFDHICFCSFAITSHLVELTRRSYFPGRLLLLLFSVSGVGINRKPMLRVIKLCNMDLEATSTQFH